MAALGCASLKASPPRAEGEGSERAGRSPCWLPGPGMGMKLGRAMGLGTGSSEGGSVRRESPSVSWGHPTSAVPAQCSAPRLSAAGEGMSCSGLCSVQLPSQFWEPGLISALVTAGRSAGSSAKPRLVQPGATASRCVQQFKESLFFGFFSQAAPGKCFIILARYLAGGSGSSEATRCLSLPGLGMLLADPGTAAPSLLSWQLPGASSSTGWFPASSPFLQLPRG